MVYPWKGTLPKMERALTRLSEDSLHQRIREDLATNVRVTEHDEGDDDWPWGKPDPRGKRFSRFFHQG